MLPCMLHLSFYLTLTACRRENPGCQEQTYDSYSLIFTGTFTYALFHVRNRLLIDAAAFRLLDNDYNCVRSCACDILSSEHPWQVCRALLSVPP